jgi:hypothetical protein
VIAHYIGVMDTDGIKRPTQVKGHALRREWEGKQGTSRADGTCECGWRFPGWTHTMSMVVSAHRSHLRRVKLGFGTEA